MQEQLHTRYIAYEPYESGRYLRCVSVKDFFSAEPLDFRELFPEDIAEVKLNEISSGSAEYILSSRDFDFGASETISNMDRIIGFLGKLS